MRSNCTVCWCHSKVLSVKAQASLLFLHYHGLHYHGLQSLGHHGGGVLAHPIPLYCPLVVTWGWDPVVMRTAGLGDMVDMFLEWINQLSSHDLPSQKYTSWQFHSGLQLFRFPFGMEHWGSGDKSCVTVIRELGSHCTEKYLQNLSIFQCGKLSIGIPHYTTWQRCPNWIFSFPFTESNTLKFQKKSRRNTKAIYIRTCKPSTVNFCDLFLGLLYQKYLTILILNQFSFCVIILNQHSTGSWDLSPELFCL